MAKGKKKLVGIDLSKYETADRLPANVVSIIKNALIVYEGSTAKVSKLYKISKEKVDLIFEENYLQLIHIIESQTKSKELDQGISNAISLMTDHISDLEHNKTADIMTKSTVNDVIRMTEKMVALKTQFNNTYDTLINKMNEQAFKARQLDILENGKSEDSDDYNENLESVFSKLKTTSRKIKATNIKTKEVKNFESIRDAAFDFKCNGDTIRKRLADKCLFRDEWAFEEV